MSYGNIIGSTHDDSSFLSLSSLEPSIAQLNKLHVATKHGKGTGKTQKLVDAINKHSQQLVLEVAAIKVQRMWRSHQSLSFVRRVNVRRQRLTRHLQIQLQQVPWIGNRLLDEISIFVSTIISLDLTHQANQILLHRQYRDDGIIATCDHLLDDVIADAAQHTIEHVVHELVANIISDQCQQQDKMQRIVEESCRVEEMEMMHRADLATMIVEDAYRIIEARQQHDIEHPDDLVCDAILLEVNEAYCDVIVPAAVREVLAEYMLNLRAEDVCQCIIHDFIISQLYMTLPIFVDNYQPILVADQLLEEVLEAEISVIVHDIVHSLQQEIIIAKRKMELKLISDSLQRGVVRRLVAGHLIHHLITGFDDVLVRKHVTELASFWTARRLLAVTDASQREWDVLSRSPLLCSVANRIIAPTLQNSMISIWTESCSQALIEDVDRLEAKAYDKHQHR